MFVACYSGANQNDSLLNAAVAAGADVAIGFREAINCFTANEWVRCFFDYYTQGFSIVSSALMAIEDCDYEGGTDSVRVVFG